MSSVLLDPRNVSPGLLIEQAVALGLSERHVRRWLGAVIGQGHDDPEWSLNAGILPRNFAQYLLPVQRLALEHSVISPIDGFQKLVFRTLDNLSIESVIIPLKKTGAATLCISSQVGCVMGCTFCATARMPQRRNLETWEIVDQFLQARALAQNSGKRITGVVFMGMGEPFLNYDRVLAAAELFCYPVINAISAKAITISTVGLVQEIDRFTSEQRPFRLSISLGAATDEKRRKLVPIAARTPVATVMEAGRRYGAARNERIMLAYVCISGENVAEDDARALGELIGNTPVRLDLIEVTDATGRYQRPNESEMTVFRDALTKYVAQPVVRRYSGGADIQAACGTLAGKEASSAARLLQARL